MQSTKLGSKLIINTLITSLIASNTASAGFFVGASVNTQNNAYNKNNYSPTEQNGNFAKHSKLASNVTFEKNNTQLEHNETRVALYQPYQISYPSIEYNKINIENFIQSSAFFINSANIQTANNLNEKGILPFQANNGQIFYSITHENLSKLQDLVNSQEMELKKQIQKAKQMEENLNRYKEDLKTSNEKREKFEAELSDKEKEIADLANQKGSLEFERIVENGKIEQFTKNINKLQSEVNLYKTTSENLKNTLKNHQETLLTKAEEIKALMEQKNSIEKELEIAKSNSLKGEDYYINKLNEINQQKINKDYEIANFTQEFNSITSAYKTEISRLNKNISNLKEDLTKNKNDFKEEKNGLILSGEALQNDLNNLNRNITHYLGDNQMNDSIAILQNANKTIEASRTEKENLENLIKNATLILSEDIKVLRKQNNTEIKQENLVKNIEDALVDKKLLLEKHQQEVQKANARIKDLGYQVGNYTETIAELRNNQTNFEKQISDAKNIIIKDSNFTLTHELSLQEALQKRLDNLNNNITALEKNKAELNSEIKNLTEASKSFEAQSEKAFNLLAKVGEDAREYSNNITRYKDTIAEKEKEIKSLNNTISNQRNEINDIKSILGDDNLRMQANNTLTETLSLKEAVQKKLENLNNDIARLEKEKTGLHDNIQTLIKKESELESSKSNVENHLHTKIEELRNSSDRVKELDNIIERNNQQIGSLKKEKIEIETKFADATEEIANLKEQVKTLNEKISELENTEELVKKLKYIESQKEIADAYIKKLEAQIEASKKLEEEERAMELASIKNSASRTELAVSLIGGYKADLENFALITELGLDLANSKVGNNIQKELEVENKFHLYLTQKVGYKFKSNNLTYVTLGLGFKDYKISYLGKYHKIDESAVIPSFIIGVGYEYQINNNLSAFTEFNHIVSLKSIETKAGDVKTKSEQIRVGARWYF